jgi:NAD(P)-dependent dehydrogenase (short-subunit alcohol dehydrogenase family)
MRLRFCPKRTTRRLSHLHLSGIPCRYSRTTERFSSVPSGYLDGSPSRSAIDYGVAEAVGRATCEGADSVRDQMTQSMPTGRFSTPSEVATIVALLASPRLANVTRANWVIDGGLVKTT